MTDLASGQVGPEANYKLSLEEGKVVVALNYTGAQADASLMVKLNAESFIDQLAAMIPGKIDDAIFAMLKGALK